MDKSSSPESLGGLLGAKYQETQLEKQMEGGVQVSAFQDVDFVQ